MNTKNLYRVRFSQEERQQKVKIWKVLCERFFQRYIKESDTVLDLGAGFCDFINQIRCGERIAVDTNPDIQQYAIAGTRVIISPSTDISAVDDSSVDVVFASNFFEHLRNKEELIQTLQEIKRILRRDGKLLVLQPNIRYVGGKYWDFFDHNLPITDRMLVEVFGLIGFEVVEVRSRFLPYSTKSKFPQSPFLVRLYLALPIIQYIFGEQSFVVGIKTIS
jgi:SAM-dependent methyltransferase